VLAGCHGCVTVCRSGGEKEVQVLASALRLAREAAGRPLEIKEATIERQCDPEYVETMRPYVEDYQAVLSIACGAGVQFLAERFAVTPLLPGINTNFIGVTEKQGVWAERCQSCGDCVLHLTGGICPVTRCSKSIFNGPCGGSVDGHCEIDKEVACGWQLIVDRLKALGQLDNYEKIRPMKGWRASRDGGPRRIVREDLAQ
ncbi:methylenetetrahydrofolate reductase C-terminal domain-containing protein, partial [Thermodesulfobacteriota bacterium]